MSQANKRFDLNKPTIWFVRSLKQFLILKYKAVWELSYSKIKYYLCKEHLGKKKENDINRRTDGGIRREAIV